jgi:hypothetical protein
MSDRSTGVAAAQRSVANGIFWRLDSGECSVRTFWRLDAGERSGDRTTRLVDAALQNGGATNFRNFCYAIFWCRVLLASQ